MSPLRTSIIVFTASFFIGLTCVNYVNDFYAKKGLESDADNIIHQFQLSLKEAHLILSQLAQSTESNCSEESMIKMDQMAYKSSSVRLLGIREKTGSECSSKPKSLIQKNHHPATRKKDDPEVFSGFFLTQTGNKNNHSLIMYTEKNDTLFFASIYLPKPDYINNFSCNSCISYRFKLHNIDVISNQIVSSPFVQYTSSKQIKNNTISFTLKGDRALYQNYKTTSWETTLLISLIVSILASGAYYQISTSNRSFSATIKSALRNNEFVPYYQPIIDSRSGKISGTEVLVRWHQKNGKVITPNQFIPFAEESGLITAITRQLIKQVSSDIVSLGWGNGDKFMSINIVPADLTSNQLFDFMSEEINKHGISAKCFSIEVTERLPITDLKQAKIHLDPFSKAGMDIKLDDAGTGYGGFSYIQELGIGTLKIDKMFVDTIMVEDVKQGVLESMIEFAKSSHLKVIAEGVETEDQLAYLNEHGVYLIQGYVYAKPMPFNELADWLTDRNN